MNVTTKKQTIKAGDTLVERGLSNFFYCNETSAPFNLRMGDGSSLKMSSRRKVKMQEPLDIFYLENTSDKDIVLEYTMGFGEFSDESMYIEGQIGIANNNETSIFIRDTQYSAVNTQRLIIVNGKIDVIPSGSAKKVIMQNTGNNNMTVFGLLLVPTGSLELNYSNPFEVLGVDGDMFVMAEFE